MTLKAEIFGRDGPLVVSDDQNNVGVGQFTRIRLSFSRCEGLAVFARSLAHSVDRITTTSLNYTPFMAGMHGDGSALLH